MALLERPNALWSAPDAVKLVFGLLAVSTRWPLPSSVADTAPELPRPAVPLIADSIELNAALAAIDTVQVVPPVAIRRLPASSLLPSRLTVPVGEPPAPFPPPLSPS